MLTRRKGNIIEADIHGMTSDEAYRDLLRLIDHAGRDVAEIHVIHGYRHGDTLKSMVMTRLRHPRIAYRLPSLQNDGVTKLFLKKTGK